jgi:hypothetical protein
MWMYDTASNSCTKVMAPRLLEKVAFLHEGSCCILLYTPTWLHSTLHTLIVPAPGSHACDA